MPDRLRIRPARVEDAAAAAAVLRDSIRVLCTADHGDDPDLVGAWCANKTPGQVAGWIADPEGHLFVAELDGRRVGYWQSCWVCAGTQAVTRWPSCRTRVW